MTKDFIFWGRILFEGGLVSSHSGNMSVKKGHRIYITKTGAVLGFLKSNDILKVNLKRGKKGKASSEVNFHRLLYDMKDASAIVHTHPPYTVALSFTLKKFIPEDMEGKHYINEVPIVEIMYPYNYPRIQRLLEEILTHSFFFIVKGHGLFVMGKNLEDAVHLSFTIEHSAKVYTLRRILR